MKVRPTVVLFDIDGTLIRTGYAGTRALRRTFAELFDAPEAPGRVDVRGNTDLRILRTALEHAGERADAETLERTLSHYLEVLAHEVATSPGYEVLAGAEALVRRAEREGFAVGLGTGNVRRGAEIKLARSGFGELFRFGGFGCDAEQRERIIGRGAARGAELLHATLEECRVIVIGDTPHDVRAGHAIGAEVLAVATGGHPSPDLLEAEYVVESLTDSAALSALLGR